MRLNTTSRTRLASFRRAVAPSDLMDAAFAGDIVRLRHALAAGASPDAADGRGWTALTYAVLGHHVESVQALLDAGADANRPAVDGTTALMKAALWGDTAVVAVLLAHGADQSPGDADGWTAERIAREQGFDDIVRLLGAARNSRCEKG